MLTAIFGFFAGKSVVASIFDFFKTPVGQIVGIALIGVTIWVTSDVRATLREKAVCQGIINAANLKATDRDKEIARQAKILADQQTKELQEQYNEATKKLTAFERLIAATTCRFLPH